MAKKPLSPCGVCGKKFSKKEGDKWVRVMIDIRQFGNLGTFNQNQTIAIILAKPYCSRGHLLQALMKLVESMPEFDVNNIAPQGPDTKGSVA